MSPDPRGRLKTLQWMVGISIAWNTVLIGAVIGLIMKDISHHEGHLRKGET